MIKTYFATANADLKLPQEHINRHDSPPCITGGITTISGGITTIEGSPGMHRLSAMENPKYFEQCLRNLFDMAIEWNARICMQGMDTNAAAREYLSTKLGNNYAETKTNEERAWVTLCRVHGNITPRTEYNRIEFLLALCAKYQGHTKTKRTLLKELHRKGVTLTNVPFSVAVPIIGAAAKLEDEINAQMATGVAADVAVNTVGAATQRNVRNNDNGKSKMGAVEGVAACKICSKPGHNARDCL